MKNFRKIFLSSIISICLHTIGMEQSPQPIEGIPSNTASFDTLPPDIKRLLVPLIASSKVAEVADAILALNRTNKFFNNYLKDPANLIAILERMPYTANATDLIENYLSKTNIPVVKSPLIDTWLKNAKSQLVNGRELWYANFDLDLNSALELLRNKNINLNYQQPTNANQTSITAFSGIASLLSAEKKRNALEITQRLLNAGANPNIKDLHGETPLKNVLRNYYFIKSGKEIITALMQAGTDPELKDTSGKSARDYAVEYCPDLVQLFDDAIAKRKRDKELKEFAAQKK